MKTPAPFLSLKTSGCFAKTLVASNYKGRPYVQITHNPNKRTTSARLEQRATFLLARDAWKTLTPSEKMLYNEIGDNLKNNRMTGYNYFLSVFMKQPVFDFLLLQDGEFILLETGDYIII